MRRSLTAILFGAASAGLGVGAAACGAATTTDPGAASANRYRAADIADAAAAFDAAPSLDASIDGALALTTAAPLEPLAFGTRPDPSGPLFDVVDGPCVGLDVVPLADRSLITWGESAATIGTIKDRDIESVSWVDDANVESIDDIVGTFPDHAWMIASSGGRCSIQTRAYRWTNDHWSVLSPNGNTDNVGAYSFAGDTLFFATDGVSRCGGDGSERGFLFGDGKKAPRLNGDGAFLQMVKAFPSGEMYALAEIQTPPFASEFRFTDASGKMQKRALPGGNGGMMRVVGVNDVDFLKAETGQVTLTHFDGTTMTPQTLAVPETTPMPSGDAASFDLQRAPNGDRWIVRDGTLYVLTASGVLSRAATPDPLRFLAGVDKGAPWIVTTHGEVAKWEQDRQTWTIVPLPKPPFAEKTKFNPVGLVVRSATDVWVNATYSEKPDGWGQLVNERHRALLRTIAPDETLHCGGHVEKAKGGYVREWGFESWPPSATDACTTPLVLIADNDVTKPKGDFARTRALFAKHPELDGASYEEVASGDHRYFSAKVSTVQMGKAMVAFYAKAVHDAKPRVVCADPTPLRTFTVTAK